MTTSKTNQGGGGSLPGRGPPAGPWSWGHTPPIRLRTVDGLERKVGGRALLGPLPLAFSGASVPCTVCKALWG